MQVGWEMLPEEKREEIASKAKVFTEQHGDFSHGYLNLEKMVGDLSFDLRLFPNTANNAKKEGMLVFSQEEKYIALNDSITYEERRFTAAHEIGHYHLHYNKRTDSFASVRYKTNKAGKDAETKYKNAKDEEKDDGYYAWIHEQEADYFAACILMPEGLFKAHYDLSKEPSSLAKIFRVPPESVVLRKKELKLV